MKILFGSGIDGCPPPPEWRGVGKLVCGPQGLLDMLEQLWGIPPLDPLGLQSELSRLTSYREVLRSYVAAKPKAFFARSFAAESLSTSGALLGWRDELRLAGWDPQRTDGETPSRLREFAEIENLAPADAHFRHGQAERLARLIEAVEKGIPSGIESITVLDAPESLPQLWRDLFRRLGAIYDPQLPSKALAPAGTALHLVQDHLLDGKLEKPPGFQAADGSVTVLSDFSETTLAQAAAHRWRDESLRSATTLIAPVAERARLNEALRDLDLPGLAARPPCLAGALQQLPLLTLRLCWQPFDPQAWLEFLLHPVCPLPGVLRHRLAKAINDTAGRGNSDWNRAIRQAGEKLASYPDGRREKTQGQIDTWLNLPLCDPGQGAEGRILADVLKTLAQWVASVGQAKSAADPGDQGGDAGDGSGEKAVGDGEGGADPEAPAYLVAALEMRRFAEVLGSMETVSRPDLERLLGNWLPSTSAGASQSGELGSVGAVASPAQVLAPCADVAWWKPVDFGSRRSPWLRSEQEWLAENGAVLVEAEATLRAEERNARRAVLHATRSLTLFSPVQASGDEAMVSSILTRLLAELGSGIVSGGRALVASEDLAVRLLPEPRRWWQLGETVPMEPREQESYSSISKLIYSPYQWVLDYQAKLRKGNLFGYSGGDDFMRRGTLLHDLAEKLFASNPGEGGGAVDWTQFKSADDLQTWLAGVWPGLLEQRAAQYLLPLNEFAGKSLLHTAQQSLWKLTRIFQQAGVASVEVEKYIGEVPFAGGKLHGFIDMVLHSPAGVAVVDLKLGGKGTREKELEENRHLQLALYGKLLQHSEKVEASAAFYIFANGGELLTRSAGFFPSASPVRRRNADDAAEVNVGEEWAGCWREFEQIWNWRWRQLQTGRIEVTVTGTEADQSPPLEHWAAPDNADKYNDFDALTGWPRTA